MPTSIVDVGKDEDQTDIVEELTKEIAAEQQAGESEVPNDGADLEPIDPLAGTKFEGKSVKEILESYNNLQSAYGRMANDLGTQRKLTDKLLDLKRDEDLQRNEPPPKVETDELLNDPTAALDRYLQTRMAQMQSQYDERLQSFEQQLMTERFKERHPTFEQTAQSPEFQQWIESSPLRSQAAALAANGDWQAADALFTEYETQAVRNDDTGGKVATDDLAAARNVSLESSTPSGEADKKVYSRAQLIDLKINKPHVWKDPSFQARIYKAYEEGRVR